MNERRVSVFGATGFLGRRLVRELAASGWRVRVVARHPQAIEIPETDSAQLEFCTADICDETSVASAVDGAQAVVNAVSLYVERGDLTFDALHVKGAERLARKSLLAGVKSLLHVSGIGSDPESRSALIRAKGEGEKEVAKQFPGAWIVRPSVMIGAGDSFLSNLELLTRSPVVPLFGAGKVRSQPAAVDDVAAAIARLAERESQAGTVLEFGGGEILSYRQAVRIVCSHLGRRRLLLPLPMTVWKILAGTMSILPNPPLTIDQLYLLASDNVADPDRDGFAQLGMQPRSLSGLLSQCLGSATGQR